MICQDVEELSGAYVLDAVTPLERETLEAHLVSCPNCMHLVQELQLVADLLPLSVPSVEPSPSLQAHVLMSIQAEDPHREQIQLRRQRTPKARWQRWMNPLVAIAAVLLLTLLTGMTLWNISLEQQVRSLSTPTPSSIPYAIKGTTTVPGASGQLLYLPALDITVLTINGLPQATRGQIYQGWLLHCKQPLSIGVLNVKNGVASESFRGNVKGYDEAAVSLEPGPGASKDAPKGQIVATGRINPSISMKCPAS